MIFIVNTCSCLCSVEFRFFQKETFLCRCKTTPNKAKNNQITLGLIKEENNLLNTIIFKRHYSEKGSFYIYFKFNSCFLAKKKSTAFLYIGLPFLTSFINSLHHSSWAMIKSNALSENEDSLLSFYPCWICCRSLTLYLLTCLHQSSVYRLPFLWTAAHLSWILSERKLCWY